MRAWNIKGIRFGKPTSITGRSLKRRHFLGGVRAAATLVLSSMYDVIAVTAVAIAAETAPPSIEHRTDASFFGAAGSPDPTP